MQRRSIAAALALAGLVAAAPVAVHAQAFPSRPIKLVIPFGPGSGTDTIARALGEQLSSQLGVPVVPENREGAGGVIGTQQALRAPADGYTIVMVSNALTIAPQLYVQPPFDPVADVTPIAKAAAMPLSFAVSAKSPFKSLREVIDFAKANPGKLSFATSGKGSQSQLEVEYIKQVFNVQMTDVPYKSVGQAMTDLISDTVSFYFPIFPGAQAQMKSGNVRVLAVGSSKRVASSPDVPTFIEALNMPGYVPAAWFGLAAPKGTPPEVVRRLSDETLKALAAPRLRERLEGMGAEVTPQPSAEFGAEIRAEQEKWTKVIAPLNLKTQ